MNPASEKSIISKIQDIEEELNQLKIKLAEYHLIKSSEQDYDLKSQIIDKQNQIIELLIEQSKKNAQH
jgi:hypothetical protein